MIIGVRFRERLMSIGSWLVAEHDGLVANISAAWNPQHKDDGSHGAVTADSLVVSGTTTTGAVTITTSSSTPLIINSTYKNGGYVTFQRSGVNKAFLGPSIIIDGSGTNDDIELYSVGNIYLIPSGGPVIVPSANTSGLQFGNVGRFRWQATLLRLELTDAAAVNFVDLVVNRLILFNVLTLRNYTVATLPAGVQGNVAYVTDLLAPGFLAIAVGGGAVVGPVFYNGANWVAM